MASERKKTMIVVIATIETTAGNRDALLAVFKNLVPLVLAEEGCIEYAPMIDVATPLTGQPPRENVVTMVEKWASLEALQAHLASPHMAAFRKASESLRLQLNLQILEPGL
jgi:quinol monooxygenase YgiN